MWIWTLLMVFTVAICEEEKPNTILVFYMEKNLEQEEDFVELALTVNTKDYTLMKALNDARAIVDGVKTASNEYCLAEGGEECDSIVEVENYDIDFTYQRVKREPKYNGILFLYSGCVVKHEITITLRNTENIGVLVDRLLSKFGDSIIINGQEWKPEVEEDVEEKVIDEGLAQGRDLCSHIGKEMGDIIKIE